MVPLKEMGREEVPDHLWLSIKEKVGAQADLKKSGQGWLGGLAESFFFPGFQPALAGLMLLILTGTITFQNQWNQQSAENEQREYLAFFFGPTDLPPQLEDNTSSTPVEEYFL